MGDGRIERDDSDTIVFAGDFRQIVVKRPQPLVFCEPGAACRPHPGHESHKGASKRAA